jgi:hypothetical protein
MPRGIEELADIRVKWPFLNGRLGAEPSNLADGPDLVGTLDAWTTGRSGSTS